MTEEEALKEKLVSRFGLTDNIKIQRPRRIILDINAQDFDSVLEYAVKDLEFSMLCTITGLDEGQNFGIIYHMARTDGIILNIKINIPKENPILNTIINYFPNSDIYERELVDLLGIKVKGLPAGVRYPLPDDWPQGQYPLRKDWNKDSLKR